MFFHSPELLPSVLSVFRYLLTVCLLVGLMTAATAQQAAHITLRPNDKIEVRVFQQEDLTQQAVISTSGSVQLSLIGSIFVAGLTPEQAAQKIRTAYANGFLVNPQVSVSVVQPSKRLVIITGHVARPGPVEIKPGERLSLVQAIAEAGGLTRLASQRCLLVKRTKGSRERLFHINYKKLVTDPILPPFYLEEGDIVTVKEAIF